MTLGGTLCGREVSQCDDMNVSCDRRKVASMMSGG